MRHALNCSTDPSDLTLTRQTYLQLTMGLFLGHGMYSQVLCPRKESNSAKGPRPTNGSAQDSSVSQQAVHSHRSHVAEGIVVLRFCCMWAAREGLQSVYTINVTIYKVDHWGTTLDLCS